MNQQSRSRASEKPSNCIDKRGFRIDIFEQQIVGKVWITDRMRDRAEEFWTGSFVTAFILLG